MHATFDTHAAVTALREAGIDEAHAEAIVNTVRDASIDRSELATKADLEALRSSTKAGLCASIAEFRFEMRWMFGF